MTTGRCPRCGPDHVLLDGYGALHDAVCGGCQGRFLDAEALERVVVEEHGIPKAMLVELAAFFGGRALRCPGCSAAMKPITIRGTQLDLCTGCGGCWCDAGELHRLSQGRHEEVQAPHALVQGAVVDETVAADEAAATRSAPTSSAAIPSVVPRDEASPPALVGRSRPGASWCVFQMDLAPLDVEHVRAAFVGQPRLTAVDAVQMARNAYGVLADALTADEAAALHQALAAQGVESAVLPDERLALPHPRLVSRMEISEQALHPFDQYGRRETVPWARVRLVAAGQVGGKERVERRYKAQASLASSSRTRVEDGVEVEFERTTSDELLLDVLLDEPVQRLRGSSASFVFVEATARGALVRDELFRQLVRRVLAHASRAVTNQGAADLRDDGRRVHRYRSMRSYEREIAWLRWRFGV